MSEQAMTSRPVLPALEHLCQVVCPTSASGVSDAELLDRFLSRRDETAFELLVWRHGPLVLGVCGRILKRTADIEDAFQATFLMLVRKAHQIGKRGSVGSWLYKVAYRISLRTQCRSEKRHQRERPLSGLPAEAVAPSSGEATWQELRPILDSEVSRLPERYRAPFILCYLEGKTNSEAARELGCPRGTVDSRLARARERLRDRLTRRGVELAAWSLAPMLALESARVAEALPVLVHGTVQAALLWSLRGLVGVAGSSTGTAQLLAAEARAFSRKWYVLGALVMLLALAGTSWGVYRHGGNVRQPPPEHTEPHVCGTPSLLTQ
jgi:RNA polymerase sigma factor (sigma-70 family)